jgi:hypothetical protein
MKTMIVSGAVLALGLVMGQFAAASPRHGGHTYRPSGNFGRTISTVQPRYSTVGPKLTGLPLTVQPRTLTGPTLSTGLPLARATSLSGQKSVSLPVTRLPLGRSALAARKATFAKKVAAGYCLPKNCGQFLKCVWSSKFGCFLFWCPLKCGWFYFYDVCDCYVPICDIDDYPPVCCLLPVEVWLMPCLVYDNVACPDVCPPEAAPVTLGD